MPESHDHRILYRRKEGEKRLAERKTMQNIRKDPEKYVLWKLKMKETYLKRKRDGKIVSVQNLTPKQQKIAKILLSSVIVSIKL